MVLIDLEITCEPSNAKTKEIIRIAYSVYDTSQNAVTSSVSLYVKPRLTDSLHPLCALDSGITDKQLSDAPALADVLTHVRALPACLAVLATRTRCTPWLFLLLRSASC